MTGPGPEPAHVYTGLETRVDCGICPFISPSVWDAMLHDRTAEKSYLMGSGPSGNTMLNDYEWINPIWKAVANISTRIQSSFLQLVEAFPNNPYVTHLQM